MRSDKKEGECHRKHSMCGDTLPVRATPPKGLWQFYILSIGLATKCASLVQNKNTRSSVQELFRISRQKQQSVKPNTGSCAVAQVTHPLKWLCCQLFLLLNSHLRTFLFHCFLEREGKGERKEERKWMREKQRLVASRTIQTGDWRLDQGL